MNARQIAGRRIVILCEGDTEEIVVRHFLRRQWSIEGLDRVGLHADNLQGGLSRVGTKASLFLDEDDVLGVFTLIDLYGCTQVKHGAEDEIPTKVTRVQEWLRSSVKNARADGFHPFVSVHEVEALILAEGAALAARLSAPHVAPDPNAETKNFLRPPSKRLDELFRAHKKRGYHKILDGTPLFQKMHFDPVYQTCPYFRRFFENLRDVARA
jgi:hypothetical protein